jgi:hypothetical protein
MERGSGTTDPIDTKSARPDDLFSTETAGLSEAAHPPLIRLHDGDRFDLRIEPVRKRLEDAELRMLGTTVPSPAPRCRSTRGRRSPCR